MQGEYLYGAMDGGSQISPRALADPLGPDNTIETGFLQLALLKGVLTDTHFSERNRLGRLIAFFDRAVVNDTGINGPGEVTEGTGFLLKLTQTGKLPNYAVAMIIGVVVLAIVGYSVKG